MKRLIFTFFIAMSCLCARAQQIEEITSWEKTFKGQLSSEQLKKRFQARRADRSGESAAGSGSVSINSMGEKASRDKFGIEIVPDTLYAGEPFDVHYTIIAGHEATCELYDLSGKRPKQIITKRASTPVNGSVVLRVTLDKPGVYEVVAYDEELQMMVNDPESVKSRWKITVHDRNATKRE